MEEKMKKNLMAGACCALMFSLAPLAHSANGPYVSGRIGGALANNSDVSAADISNISAEVQMDTGLGLGMAAGYGFGRTRLEGEINYQKNDLDSITVNGFGSIPLSGDVTSLAFLINGYFDFTNDGPVTSFLTAGVGMANVEVDNFNIPGSGLPNASDDDTVLAYQVGGGIGFPLTEQITLDLTYRYFATLDPDFGELAAEYSSHNLYLGLRLAF
jgi:opacity protein-like surface antigen